ncbi:undecaprenyldiphospho-muramoylpentapeptide beta-N-acetylglucosaminyltransferase [Aestuariimicrobium ganziense]|uniref:undecaprenyldiphospho-muramoylpentapeptide beta-N-acetylglucosaminyltransferase n=1 Tax=Aestuariimicrobium ganziense TaxID=2773677 RepID=UPI0019459F14|nr:undecaprenyldiphospho-muramoylpentapeptide beta-N-acetylglucosaminyltransferase [Aestuariimicrobium ganziense]
MTSVVLAGGGTAGHTSPLIATAEALREAGVDSLSAIGTSRGLETTVIPAAGLELDLVDPVPLPRRPSVELAKVPLRLGRAVAQARDILRRRRADVLVGFGGYVSLPAYLAARTMGVPVVIHEQNALPGLANKAAARFAHTVAVSFPDTPLPKAQFIGLPVRAAIADLARTGRTAARVEARAALGLDADRPTLLVSGGSQGARSINEATVAARNDLLAAGVQVLHVWGAKNFTDQALVRDETTGAAYQPVPYVPAMEQAYAAADLMVGRSGAGTVVETAVVGLPAVFVPLPHGNGEQARNAVASVEAGAAVLVADAELDAARLVAEVVPRITDPDTLQRMGEAGTTLMSPDAARQLAEFVRAAQRPRRRRGVGHGAA